MTSYDSASATRLTLLGGGNDDSWRDDDGELRGAVRWAEVDGRSGSSNGRSGSSASPLSSDSFGSSRVGSSEGSSGGGGSGRGGDVHDAQALTRGDGAGGGAVNDEQGVRGGGGGGGGGRGGSGGSAGGGGGDDMSTTSSHSSPDSPEVAATMAQVNPRLHVTGAGAKPTSAAQVPMDVDALKVRWEEECKGRLREEVKAEFASKLADAETEAAALTRPLFSST